MVIFIFKVVFILEVVKSSRLFFDSNPLFFQGTRFYHLLELKVGSQYLWLLTENEGRETQYVAPYWKCK